MNDSINNFITLLTKGDFFLIFLIIMMVIIIGVIVYLVKLQSSDTVYYDRDDEEDDEDDEDEIEYNRVMLERLKEKELNKKDVASEQIKVEPIKYEEEVEEDLFEEELESVESLLKEQEEIIPRIDESEIETPVEYSGNLVFENPAKASRNIKQSRFNFDEVNQSAEEVKEHNYEEEISEKENLLLEKEDTINEFKNFEEEQEATAIISASELENRLNELRASGEIVNHEKEIQKYEEEQETKAIISYDELLTRASQNNISYESEEELGGIRVSKVDTSTIEHYSEVNDKPYYKEESFLQALKEFRQAL